MTTSLTDSERALFVAPYLQYWEILCPRSQRAIYTLDLLRAWERFRLLWGSPISIISGYRCPDYNRQAGGSPTSRHLTGEAIDIGVSSFLRQGVDPYSKEVFFMCLDAGFQGIGRRASRLHLDVRKEPMFWEYFYPIPGRLATRHDPQGEAWFAEWRCRHDPGN